jgi:hypothetical protein
MQIPLGLKRLVRPALLAFGSLLVVTAALDGPITRGTVRVLVAALGVTVLILLHTARYAWVRPSSRLFESQVNEERGKSRLQQLTVEQLVAIRDTPSVRREEIRAFGLLIGGLQGRAQHIHESYRLGDHAMERRVTIEYDLSQDLIQDLQATGAEWLSFPIMTVKKGFLPDDLSTYINDRPASVAAYDDVLELLLNACRSLAGTAFGSEKSPWLICAKQIARLGKIPEVVTGKPRQYYSSADTEQRLRGWFAAQRPVDDEEEAKRRAQSFGQLLRFMDLYTDAYPVCILISIKDIQQHLHVTYTHSTPIQGPPSRTFRDDLRAWFGVGPHVLQVKAMLQYLAKSYHLVVHGPTNAYLFAQEIVDLEKGEIIAPHALEEPSTRSYVRRQPWNPSPSSHLYMRGFRELPTRDLWVRVSFDERPPGALGAAAVMSLLLFGLTFTLAALSEIPGSGTTLDVVAMFIALPAVAGGLLGGTELVQRRFTALSTRTGLLGVVVLSGVSLIVYALSEKGVLRSLPNWTWGLAGMEVPVHSSAWNILLLIVGFQTWWLVGAFVIRTMAYNRRVKQSGRFGNGEEWVGDSGTTTDPFEPVSDGEADAKPEDVGSGDGPKSSPPGGPSRRPGVGEDTAQGSPHTGEAAGARQERSDAPNPLVPGESMDLRHDKEEDARHE